MRFVDSHTHLADAAFDADRDDAIARARLAGAAALVCIGESIQQANRARGIAQDYPGFVYFTAGVHPHDAADFDSDRDIPLLRQLVRDGAVAVGECGLDYHYDHSPRTSQIAAFSAQIDLAREVNRPVVVHSREAVSDTQQMVVGAGKNGVLGVMHCFTGPLELARAALDAGWCISFAGVVTFKKWDQDDLIRLVPDDRLLVETDAPYLSPVPHRGKRNEPGLIPHTIEKIAGARRQSASHVAECSLSNAARLFGLEIT